MYILGVSCFYHDSAAALLQDGRLLAACEEERLSRVKHDQSFPKLASQWCLKKAGITIHDVDYVVFYEKPFAKFARIVKTGMAGYPSTARLFARSMTSWLGEKLWMEAIIRESLGYAGEILYSEHHLSHAASSFFCSPFDEAAILTVDGVGEWSTSVSGSGRGNQITLDEEIQFPHSIGLLYSTFTAFLGFEVNEGEYKVMGMAPYGEPKYVDKVMKVVKVHDDGSFWLDLDYFAFHRTPDTSYSQKFLDLFGTRRDRTAEFFTRKTHADVSGREAEADKNQYYADIAASIQKVTEDILIRMARNLRKKTGLNKLCLAGGVALNSVANYRIRQESGFDDIYIQPAAGDPGGALGAALVAHRQLLNKSDKFVMEHGYYGPSYSQDEAKAYFDYHGIACVEHKDESKVIEKVVDYLARGQVVGWHQGELEWGPRALGHRSILANPTRADMKEIVNTKIKFREPFRPFAPSCIIDKASEYFEFPNPESHYPARFMLYVTKVKESARDKLPAITHVDGTARPQLVRKEHNPMYYNLIQAFGQKTGVYSVLNTSFNLKGEPIVCAPQDSYLTVGRSGIDMLVIGNIIVEKNKSH